VGRFKKNTLRHWIILALGNATIFDDDEKLKAKTVSLYQDTPDSIHSGNL